MSSFDLVLRLLAKVRVADTFTLDSFICTCCRTAYFFVVVRPRCALCCRHVALSARQNIWIIRDWLSDCWQRSRLMYFGSTRKCWSLLHIGRLVRDPSSDPSSRTIVAPWRTSPRWFQCKLYQISTSQRFESCTILILHRCLCDFRLKESAAHWPPFCMDVWL